MLTTNFGRTFTSIGPKTAVLTEPDSIFFLDRDHGWFATFNVLTLLPGQRGEDRAVGPVELRLWVLSPQHRDLLAQYEQLGVLRGWRPCRQGHPAGQADEGQVEQP